MSQRVFRSPSSGSAAAAATPSRIAGEVDGRARWRQLPGGEIEVATLSDDGRLECVRVEHDGSTTPLASVSPGPRHGWGRATLILGIVLFVGTALSMDSDGNSTGILAVFIGFALIGIGAVAHHNSRDIDARLKKTYGKNAGWNEPTNLRGWTPRSASQLRAVERIADEHEGVAFVRDAGGRTVEVYTRRRARFEHYWVDEDGNAEMVDSEMVRARFLLDRALKLTCGGLFLAAVAGAFVVDHHKGLLFAVTFGGIAATVVAGALNDMSMSVARRVRHLRAAGEAWHEIRTWVEEDD